MLGNNMLKNIMICNLNANFMQVTLQAPVNITEFPYLQHVNALGRPRGDVGAGVARLLGTKLRPPPPLITHHLR